MHTTPPTLTARTVAVVATHWAGAAIAAAIARSPDLVTNASAHRLLVAGSVDGLLLVAAYATAVLACWSALTTTAYVLARIRGSRPNEVARYLLPGVRSVLDRTLVITVAASTLGGTPALALPLPVGADGGPGMLRAEQGTGSNEAPQARDVVADRAASYEVAAGDTLWCIAARIVDEALAADVDATTRTLAHHRYLARLIDLNLDRLLSGDPDLIHPGEVVVLPSDPAS